jgi:hypothetical protein
MREISEKLKEIAPPGEKLKEKEAAIRQLFMERHLSGTNPQGHHVADDLSSYPEY